MQSKDQWTSPVPEQIANAPALGARIGQSGPLAQSEGPSFEDYHASFAEFHEGYVRHYIALADTKAGLAFAVATGVLSATFASGTRLEVLANPVWSPGYALVVTCAALLLLSAVFSFLVVAPRLSVRSGEELVFFVHVAQRPNAEAYAAEIGGSSQSKLTGARLRHCFDVSKICTRKYDQLSKGVWFGLLGLVNALIVNGFF